MGFGNWLKNAGKAIVAGVKVAAPFAGAASTLLPGGGVIARGLDTFTQISQSILQTEVMFASMFGDAKKGPEWLTATAKMISHLLLQSEAFTGKVVEDQVKFDEGTKELTASLVKIWGSIKPAPAVPVP